MVNFLFCHQSVKKQNSLKCWILQQIYVSFPHCNINNNTCHCWEDIFYAYSQIMAIQIISWHKLQNKSWWTFTTTLLFSSYWVMFSKKQCAKFETKAYWLVSVIINWWTRKWILFHTTLVLSQWNKVKRFQPDLNWLLKGFYKVSLYESRKEQLLKFKPRIGIHRDTI